MSKKHLDTAQIANELRGSAFFQRAASPSKHLSSGEKTGGKRRQKEKPAAQAIKRKEGAKKASRKKEAKPERKRSINQASYHASLIESIRRVVKDPGDKTSFVRLSPEEKNQLVDIVYSYKRQGVKTSENEVVRIAIGYLLEDYHANGKESILVQVIEALNA